ncbi:FAD-dependent monooxygenase [Streptacidiphilus rugosus]|uniref:FAD-dependent monooxygenase n=1 Tax=Streptacidiphilus rugosus TaxID=405783 RepID=UPI0007C6D1E0|nr:FAD-dependent monooxygenase [Streptacidiphilus rugosus]
MDINRDYDVLVVGAGPTGLLLAGDVAAAGLRVALLERRAEESNLTRAFAVHARTLEQLDARGLADELLETGARLDSLRVFGTLRIDLGRLPSRFPLLLITPQYHTEQLLLRRALDAGATLLRGTEAVALRQDPEGVEVDAEIGGERITFRAAYAVGTDGVRSRVRELLGVDFPGESAISSVMLADVKVERPPADVLTVGANRSGFAFMAPFGDGWYRVIAWDRSDQRPDGDPVDFDALRRVAAEIFEEDHGLHDPRWLSRFHSDERQAPDYRVGRVFLAGDAAHCHSPAGGQGMNTGLQDAANLGWKLVAAVRGWAPPGLLDSYQAERHPVGRQVLRTSGGILRVALGESPALRALRTVLKTLGNRLRPLTRRGGLEVSGIAISYQKQAPEGAHRLVGLRAPDVELTLADDGKGPARLYEALRQGRFVLVGPDASAAADSWPDRLVTAASAKVTTRTVLVRPDGYVAWAAEGPTASELREGLTAWLGAPAAEPTPGAEGRAAARARIPDEAETEPTAAAEGDGPSQAAPEAVTPAPDEPEAGP